MVQLCPNPHKSNHSRLESFSVKARGNLLRNSIYGILGKEWSLSLASSANRIVFHNKKIAEQQTLCRHSFVRRIGYKV